MSAIINEVIKNSIAQEIYLEPGDEIIKINNKVLSDLIDFEYEMNSEEIILEVKKNCGEIEIIEIEKEFDENLGVIFESAVFDGIKRCLNKCIFCFVDQQPENMRKTLYIKDDDYRLSYLQGTYITLTNLTKNDITRIETLKLGPLYISIHTTNPDLRVKMLRNPNASKINEQLKWLEKNEIPIHTQIVLCPGYNDSNELIRTLNDLWKFKSIIKSVAIVPVGLTKYRENKLRKVCVEVAKETVEIVDKFNCEKKANFVQVSDEFYIMLNKEVPNCAYYNGFCQLDDGVGTIRILIDDFNKKKKKLPKSIKCERKFQFILSQASSFALNPIINYLNNIKNVKITPIIVKNSFFGEDVNVSGLITAKDILNSDIKPNNHIVIPSIMLKPHTDKFLDDITVNYLKEKLSCDITVIQNVYAIDEIIDLIIK